MEKIEVANRIKELREAKKDDAKRFGKRCRRFSDIYLSVRARRKEPHS